ncbi:hypothetical protein LPJ56_006898, partial [Coemansia sp. RSA 2599]
DSRASAQASNNNVLRFSRIAKPMRGGGGGNAQGAPAAAEEKATGRTSGFFNWGSN